MDSTEISFGLMGAIPTLLFIGIAVVVLVVVFIRWIFGHND